MRLPISRRVLLAGLVVAGAGLVAPAYAGSGSSSYARGDMVLGDPQSPITIIEYASLSCPHCASFHNNTLPRLKENYIEAGKAHLIYRDFPFDRAALSAAALARCAGPERYFAFVDVLFRTQEQWLKAQDPIAALRRVARLGGLKSDEIDACLADKELLDSILASRMKGAQQFDVSSTPTFIVNGEKLVGAQPYEAFKRLLDRMLPQPQG